MSKSRQKLGIWGENKAAVHLKTLGYSIIDRNVHTPYGEIDIVARKESTTVFVEVKTRRTKTFGYPEESITPKKRENLINSAQAYLVDHPEYLGEWQIDVISIQNLDPGKIKIFHIQNAITE